MISANSCWGFFKEKKSSQIQIAFFPYTQDIQLIEIVMPYALQCDNNYSKI